MFHLWTKKERKKKKGEYRKEMQKMSSGGRKGSKGGLQLKLKIIKKF